MTVSVLIVEDEAPLAEILKYNMEDEEFSTQIATDGREALLLLEEHRPDLVVLDWMLPELSGIDVCRTIRRKPETKNIPIIMLTAKGEEHDRIRGFNAGADDYISKPFSPKELIARIYAILRRSGINTETNILSSGDLEIDLEKHRVKRGGKEVKLAPTEYRLLKVLIKRPGRVYSREQLLDLVWGRDIYVEIRTVDVHIRRLRKALNFSNSIDLIRTVRSAGYSFEPSVE